MKACVIGGTGFIGSALVSALREHGIETDYTTRLTLDLRDTIPATPLFDVVYICAAKTRFIECETDTHAYRINVDAPREIAEAYYPAKIIYLSSEAVEKALHTNYGLHKALAEINLRSLGRSPTIVRLSKVTEDTLDYCCEYLVSLANVPGGIYHWPKQIPITCFEELTPVKDWRI